LLSSSLVVIVTCCHPEQSEGSAVAFAFALAFLSVIPKGNLLHLKTQIPQAPKGECGICIE
jgi:hypothetical protein